MQPCCFLIWIDSVLNVLSVFLFLFRMIPHKTKRGAAALARLKAYEGVPPPYDKIKRMVIPDALKYEVFCLIDFDCKCFNVIWSCWWNAQRVFRVLRLQPGHRYCLLGRLSSEVGWNYYDTVKVRSNWPYALFYVLIICCILLLTCLWLRLCWTSKI